MIFTDRRDAGRRLAAALDHLRDQHPVVLAVPRGGVVVGREVAERFCTLLDVIVPRKLRAPYNPELAIGAVAEGGEAVLDEMAHGVGAAYLEQETEAQRAEIARRIKRIAEAGRFLPWRVEPLSFSTTASQPAPPSSRRCARCAPWLHPTWWRPCRWRRPSRSPAWPRRRTRWFA